VAQVTTPEARKSWSDRGYAGLFVGINEGKTHTAFVLAGSVLHQSTTIRAYKDLADAVQEQLIKLAEDQGWQRTRDTRGKWFWFHKETETSQSEYPIITDPAAAGAESSSSSTPSSTLPANSSSCATASSSTLPGDEVQIGGSGSGMGAMKKMGVVIKMRYHWIRFRMEQARLARLAKASIILTSETILVVVFMEFLFVPFRLVPLAVGRTRGTLVEEHADWRRTPQPEQQLPWRQQVVEVRLRRLRRSRFWLILNWLSGRKRLWQS